MRRNHPTRTLLLSLVFSVACGGEPASLPDDPGSDPVTSTSGVSQPDDQATITTTTATKPGVTTNSLPVTTVTTVVGSVAATTSTTTTTEPLTNTTAEPNGAVQVPGSFLIGVIEDAATRQGVGVAAVSVLSGQPVDWPDGSLGCPEPGKSYVQVLTPGYLVMIDAGGVTLEYHLNQQGAFKQCSGGVYHPPSGY